MNARIQIQIRFNNSRPKESFVLKMTSLLEELNTYGRLYEDNHIQEKMKDKTSDEISPVEKGSTKKFRLSYNNYINIPHVIYHVVFMYAT